MLLENLLSELSKLNTNLERIASQPSSFPLSAPDVNTAQDEQERAVDPIKQAGKRTYLQHEDGGVLIVEKGEDMPGEGYSRITKSEYAKLITVAPLAESKEPALSDEERQTNLDLEGDDPDVTEDMCRNTLRELRGQLIESGLPDDEANKKIFGLLKQFSDKGSMPDVDPGKYKALYAATVNELSNILADPA